MKLVLRLIFVLLPLGCMAQTQDSLRVLWVGNSFTYYNDLPATVREIAASQGVKLSCARILKGGERFSGHLKNRALLDTLARGGWDYVILQEQSSSPAMPTGEVAREVYPFARTLDSLVHAGSPRAQVIFYMTWGHRNGCRRPVAGYPPINSYELMQARLVTSYLEMTYDNDAWCAPVGLAWRQVRAQHPDWDLYQPDNYHPSPTGSYLAANVIFTTIFRKPYLTEVRAGLPTEQAGYLQHLAQRTVLDNLVLLNIR